MRKNSNLLTLARIAWVAFCFASVYVEQKYGLNVPLGLALGLLAAGGIYLGLALWRRGIQSWRSERPLCVSGTCGSAQYEVVEETPNSTILICGCGIKHELQPRLFSVRRADGTTSPLMRRRRFGRWKPAGKDAEAMKSPYRS